MQYGHYYEVEPAETTNLVEFRYEPETRTFVSKDGKIRVPKEEFKENWRPGKPKPPARKKAAPKK